ncbi:MAG TPA: T9SS type A sorting domain-containing protein, partial [Flavobacterium alvei]|nr:T9SS type A sorting domain-containing protein [Flavobacterium alvei]
EMWSSSGNLYNVQDGQIGTARPTGGSQAVNAAVWWDADLGRELLDGTIMDKWNPNTQSLNRLFTIYNAAPVSSNNDSKKNPCLTADIFGDWREEIILRRSDNTALILFTTNIPTDKRIYTLMHDPQYRTAIAWQNSGYNQPPHPSFFLGYDMAPAPTPNIQIVSASLGVAKEEKDLDSNVVIHPNPSNGQFEVQFNSSNSVNAKVVISNLMGQIVGQKEVKLAGGNQSISLNFSNLVSGVYVVKVETEEGVSTQKIVIEK